MTTNSSHDIYWMRHALDLAARGQFSTAPNPRVGCVIVKDNHFISGGYHAKAGEAHAEIHALTIAGNNAHGATIYVTLEPCAHYGKTPPCVDALIAAQPARVVIAISDPNPLVAGKGIAKLKTAGIDVTLGVLEKEAYALNRTFFYRIKTHKPWVTLKLAASMDGKTALANGESQWITSEAARKDVHYHRLQADAILAGTGSILIDNARLSARYPTVLPRTNPLRVIIDSQLKTPTNAAIFSELGPVLIVTTQTKNFPSYPKQAEIIPFKPNAQGKVPLSELITYLGERGINHIYVEAGAALGGALINEKLINEIILYLAPTFLGAKARPLLQIPPLTCLSDKIQYRITDSLVIENDCRITLEPIG
ncbi:bifunctional diaminohydroxyphosphoribosylaminopyrimidine deaminase/5-amino-6-(5-phosphoribosylamino)uracil reductase RibD [Suttonella ornithocola]|uniref:Riboflavin biosynthesis protein RibD n=1 Tax=Suttonella ornithocola TaxID=279832 RepID=A0A380MX74_9GAMM|nr:bifunctional diaminohydroxyphosphoribosylaminopyrimidine deaminase/5-amino-6-(5-phosphoribosylamino)uracil reductase RibD [Suttonella ornithocola]SUO97159.1 Riboflavin biosynthesis protein RibD [Suttonella ornithocola]